MLNRDRLLTYRNSNQYLPNTAIHEAIIHNDTSLATRYVDMDKDGFNTDGRSIINVSSAGNTALLLALKRGDMDVALAIIAHPNVDVSLTDGNNLSPLHWACMLRQNEVINALLAKGADPTLPWVCDGYSGRVSLTAKALYEHQLDLEKFTNYYRIGRMNTELFIDGRGYKIAGEEAYSDVIFHMRELCRNLNWVGSATFKSDEDDVRRESDLFRYNFGQGAAGFCNSHNVIPVNQDIVRLLTVRTLLTIAAANTELNEIAEKPSNSEQAPAPAPAPVRARIDNSPRDNQNSQTLTLSNSPVSLLFSPRIDSADSVLSLPDRGEESGEIVDILNRDARTSLGGNRSWNIDETSAGYVLSCCFDADAGSVVHPQQIYNEAQTRIAQVLPQNGALSEAKQGQPFISSNGERSVKIVIATLDRRGWEAFCSQLQRVEHVTRPPRAV
jgi:hypothetical protein